MLAIIGALLLIIPLWKICARAGFHPALSLLAVIPYLGLIALACLLAFVDWPTEQRALQTSGE
jgi:hypothetical protein